MCCKNWSKKLLSFILTFSLSLLLTNSLRKENLTEKTQEMLSDENLYSKNRKEDAKISSSVIVNEPQTISFAGIVPLQITSKPKPSYTEEARQGRVQGKVNLQVAFQADGKIGRIWIIKGLPNGLTEQAISAAGQIRFKPLIVHGTPKTVSRTVQYSFSLY